MTEITKLIILLAKHDLPFEVRGINVPDGTGFHGLEANIQICSPSVEKTAIDAVSHAFTYGGKEGLIEVLSEKQPDVVGWLTAEEAFEYFKEALKDEAPR